MGRWPRRGVKTERREGKAGAGGGGGIACTVRISDRKSKQDVNKSTGQGHLRSSEMQDLRVRLQAKRKSKPLRQMLPR